MPGPNDIDIIRSAISGDAQAVIKAQIESVEREIIQRLAINITTREAIHELLTEVRRTVLQLEPAHDGLPDDGRTRHERIVLEHEYRQLVLRLTDEQRSCWNDIQRLKNEHRLCVRELLALQKRDTRLRDLG